MFLTACAAFGQAAAPASAHPSILDRLADEFAGHAGAFLVAVIAIVLAYRDLVYHRRAAEVVAEFERKRFESEESHRQELVRLETDRQQSERKQQQEAEAHRQRLVQLEEQKLEAEHKQRREAEAFRDEQLRRFSSPAAEIGLQVARYLEDHGDWARKALENAKLLPYANSLFAERSEHFREEKLELATRFTPFLLKRCEELTRDGTHVFLLIDAGTTLYPFFGLIGEETMKLSQMGVKWLKQLHLVTNSLPGIEQLMAKGRKASWDRYSGLAIEDCQLLPGVPVPIFAEVAGKQTDAAVRGLKQQFIEKSNGDKVHFISLVVGNWVRIRNTEPRCPIPMARGNAHRDVKQAFVDISNEIFVVSPLGKIFVGKHYSDDLSSNEEINEVLGTVADSRDPEFQPYQDVMMDNDTAKRVKLVSTSRSHGHLLHDHFIRLEDALQAKGRPPVLPKEEFSKLPIENLPNLLFPFDLKGKFDEYVVEFPHYNIRSNGRVLDMFGVPVEKTDRRR